jgi:hypothetical protein
MGPGQAQMLPQKLDQQGSWVDVTGDGLAVHRHCDGGHKGTSKSGPNGRLVAPPEKTGNR